MSSAPAGADQGRVGEWQLRLYIAGMTPTAQRTLRNLKALCEAHLAGRYRLNVIDLLEDPQVAEAEQIIAVPTLVRELPLPVRKILGDLSNTTRALAGLGLPEADLESTSDR